MTERTQTSKRPPGLGPALVGAAQLEPGVLVPGVVERHDGLPGASSPYYIGWLDSLRLSQVVYAPLSDYDEEALVAVRSKDGYQDAPSTLETRRFAHFFRDHAELVVPPILLSGRSRWIWQPTGAGFGEIHVYDSAAIIDGRCRIGGYSIAAKEGKLRREVAFILLPSLELFDERHLHELTREPAAGTSPRDVRRLPDAQHPERIVISTDWRRVEILTEPYVVAGSRGYAVMLDVRDLERGFVYGLYAGAKSLANALEELRVRQRTLIGARILLRKESDAQYAQYEVVHLP